MSNESKLFEEAAKSGSKYKRFLLLVAGFFALAFIINIVSPGFIKTISNVGGGDDIYGGVDCVDPILDTNKDCYPYLSDVRDGEKSPLAVGKTEKLTFKARDKQGGFININIKPEKSSDLTNGCITKPKSDRWDFSEAAGENTSISVIINSKFFDKGCSGVDGKKEITFKTTLTDEYGYSKTYDMKFDILKSEIVPPAVSGNDAPLPEGDRELSDALFPPAETDPEIVTAPPTESGGGGSPEIAAQPPEIPPIIIDTEPPAYNDDPLISPLPTLEDPTPVAVDTEPEEDKEIISVISSEGEKEDDSCKDPSKLSASFDDPKLKALDVVRDIFTWVAFPWLNPFLANEIDCYPYISSEISGGFEREGEDGGTKENIKRELSDSEKTKYKSYIEDKEDPLNLVVVKKDGVSLYGLPIKGITPDSTGYIHPPIAGDSLNPELVGRLQGFNAAMEAEGLTDWQITELWKPSTSKSRSGPTGIHQNDCHARGTCVDANFTAGLKSNPTLANIRKVQELAKQNGIRTVYEAKSGSYPSDVNHHILSAITASHFSFYLDEGYEGPELTPTRIEDVPSDESGDSSEDEQVESSNDRILLLLGEETDIKFTVKDEQEDEITVDFIEQRLPWWFENCVEVRNIKTKTVPSGTEVSFTVFVSENFYDAGCVQADAKDKDEDNDYVTFFATLTDEHGYKSDYNIEAEVERCDCEYMFVRATGYAKNERKSDKDTDKGKSSTGVSLRLGSKDKPGSAAVDPAKIPYGSTIKFIASDGSERVYIAHDTGTGVKERWPVIGKAASKNSDKITGTAELRFNTRKKALKNPTEADIAELDRLRDVEEEPIVVDFFLPQSGGIVDDNIFPNLYDDYTVTDQYIQIKVEKYDPRKHDGKSFMELSLAERNKIVDGSDVCKQDMKQPDGDTPYLPPAGASSSPTPPACNNPDNDSAGDYNECIPYVTNQTIVDPESDQIIDLSLGKPFKVKFEVNDEQGGEIDIKADLKASTEDGDALNKINKCIEFIDDWNYSEPTSAGSPKATSVSAKIGNPDLFIQQCSWNDTGKINLLITLTDDKGYESTYEKELTITGLNKETTEESEQDSEEESDEPPLYIPPPPPCTNPDNDKDPICYPYLSSKANNKVVAGEISELKVSVFDDDKNDEIIYVSPSITQVPSVCMSIENAETVGVESEDEITLNIKTNEDFYRCVDAEKLGLFAEDSKNAFVEINIILEDAFGYIRSTIVKVEVERIFKAEIITDEEITKEREEAEENPNEAVSDEIFDQEITGTNTIFEDISSLFFRDSKSSLKYDVTNTIPNTSIGSGVAETMRNIFNILVGPALFYFF